MSCSFCAILWTDKKKIIKEENESFDESVVDSLKSHSCLQGISIKAQCLTLLFSFIDDTDKVINGKYLTEHDKILFWDYDNIGLRSDYNGVLLLDTVLQSPLSNTEHAIKIELLLSEAVLLHQSLVLLEQNGIENSSDVINELVQKIGEAQQKSKKGIKAQKWETICLELPHASLKLVASTMVMELKSIQVCCSTLNEYAYHL